MTPKQWENISDINIAKAEQQKSNSLALRALVESLLEQIAADMQKQLQATTAAFQLNVQEIKSAKSQMEDQLAKVGQLSVWRTCVHEGESDMNGNRQWEADGRRK